MVPCRANIVAMALEGIRARLDQLLAELNRVGDTRSAAAGLYDAMVEIRAAIATIREAMTASERELVLERQRLGDAERRGKLADEIHDSETAELARIWATKHRERVELLERKRVVQQDELAYAERQFEEMNQQYRKAKAGIPPGTSTPVSGAGADPEFDRLQQDADRQNRAALVEQQLAELKRKMGRQE
jgi:hypothetical protein